MEQSIAEIIYNNENENMEIKISVLHPSWKRPSLAKQCYDTWMGNADHPENIEYILCLSEKDPTMADYEIQFTDAHATIGKMQDNGLVKQANWAAEQSTGNLIVAISDDFECPEHWDTILLMALEGKEDYCVKTQDGLQPFIMTLPIMDRKFYKRIGHIYNPCYAHMFGDEELAEVGKMLNRTIVLPDYFRHNHYTTGINPKDEVNVKNDSYFMVDREVFLKRKMENFGVVILSIMIPTIEKRKFMFNSLVSGLQKQIGDRPIEIVTAASEYMRIGQKRNDMLSRAKGEYVCAIDDDDVVPPFYIDQIMNAIRSNPDCCSLNGVITEDGLNPKRFIHSIKYTEYFEKDDVYYRPPNHLNVIKRSIATQFTFPELNFGEDTDYAMQICRSGLLKTEAEISETIYFYRYIRVK